MILLGSSSIRLVLLLRASVRAQTGLRRRLVRRFGREDPSIKKRAAVPRTIAVPSCSRTRWPGGGGRATISTPRSMRRRLPAIADLPRDQMSSTPAITFRQLSRWSLVAAVRCCSPRQAGQMMYRQHLVLVLLAPRRGAKAFSARDILMMCVSPLWTLLFSGGMRGCRHGHGRACVRTRGGRSISVAPSPLANFLSTLSGTLSIHRRLVIV